jgi:hypothetical protein
MDFYRNFEVLRGGHSFVGDVTRGSHSTNKDLSAIIFGKMTGCATAPFTGLIRACSLEYVSYLAV